MAMTFPLGWVLGSFKPNTLQERTGQEIQAGGLSLMG